MENLARIMLTKVSGIASTYLFPQNACQHLDVSQLSGISFLTPDANQALHQLNAQVQAQGGTLFVSDLFRSWDIQNQAYQDWKAGKRKDYAAPPGESWHMAGRAIDIDVQHLSFALPKEQWLAKFWDIAIPLGWEPIITTPDSTRSECWHFQYVGKDWEPLCHKMDDGQLAKCAILDAGQWGQTDPLLPILFLQAQCNRLSNRFEGAFVLSVDGILGPNTIKCVTAILGPSWTVQSANQEMIKL